VTFRITYDSPNPEPFPIPRSIIAPYWTDLDVNGILGGNIYYRIEQDTEILNTFSSSVATVNPEFANYSATMAVIITWFNVTLKASGPNANTVVSELS